MDGKLKITTTDSQENQYVNCLIFGHPGVGKTRFCGTAPSPFILDIEGGTMSLGNQSIIKVDIDTYDDVKKVFGMLKPENVNKLKLDYTPETIVIDSGTELQKKIMDVILKKNNREFAQLQDWGLVKNQLRAAIKLFRNLPYHLIITALTEESKDDQTGCMLQRPSFSGKSANEISGYMDLVLYMGIRQGKDDKPSTRYCLTQPTSNAYAKDRSGKLSQFIKPDFNEICNTIYPKEGK